MVKANLPLVASSLAYRMCPAESVILRLAEGPLEEPGGAPISYSPVTSVSRWISSRRHFRALPGSWKEMGRAGPARSSSASSGASLRRGRPGGEWF